MRPSGLYPACLEIPSRPRTNRSLTVSWNIRSILGRRIGRVARYRRFFSPAITRRSPLGDRPNPNASQRNADLISGGLGNDTVDGGDGIDTIFGGTGNDSIADTGTISGDLIYGGSGDESIDAGAGTDTVYGGLDNDTIEGGDSTDTIYGGDGEDSLVDSGGALSDDFIYGGAGDDTIAAGAREDTIYGGDDSDQIIIDDGFGADVIYGGEGGADFDTIDLSALGTGVTVTLSDNEEGILTDGTDTATFFEIENVVGTAQSDTISGTAATSSMTVDAGGGDDTVTGGTGTDELSGGSGNDVIDWAIAADHAVWLLVAVFVLRAIGPAVSIAGGGVAIQAHPSDGGVGGEVRERASSARVDWGLGGLGSDMLDLDTVPLGSRVLLCGQWSEGFD